MATSYQTAALATLGLFASSMAGAQSLTIPTPTEAKAAVVAMFGDPDLATSMKTGHVVLGTCKKTSKPTHEGEVSCTIAVVMGAGSSETQANFYRAGDKWVATPSSEDLPFPDPKLR